MDSEYQAQGSIEAITVEMGRFKDSGDFVSQVSALRHDVAIAVRTLAEGFSHVDTYLLRKVVVEEVGRYFSKRLTIARTTAFDVFDRMGEAKLRDPRGRLVSVLSEELDHEQAESVAALWDSRLDQQGYLSGAEQIALTVGFLRGEGSLEDITVFLDESNGDIEQG